jgi:hypothetical protein
LCNRDSSKKGRDPIWKTVKGEAKLGDCDAGVYRRYYIRHRDAHARFQVRQLRRAEAPYFGNNSEVLAHGNIAHADDKNTEKTRRAFKTK